MEYIQPAALATPRGHYSPAVRWGDLVFVSGQLPTAPDGQVRLSSIEEQVHLCLKNIETILKASGSGLNQILKVNIYLSDIALWPRVNAAYAAYLGEHRPARVVIPCGPLHYGCSVEIDCVAAVSRMED
ncbi:MAG: RidA family protein [Saprospiraceae bacterium]|nr:RidA family protein [Saprospiraceae bacterium]MDW8483038.1 RidA family protein [Saprospiraceae bacterium]